MTHPRNQDGFALIEVIVSAAVIALVALAVLSGIDGANMSSARERARAVAGSLAEQDQERMRSYKFDKLAVIPQVAPKEVDGVMYTVKSEATWVTDDANATPACGDQSVKQAEYLRITTTVTSQMVGARIPAVKIESLVAPSVQYAQDHGTLAVKIVTGKVARAAGITVTANGAGNPTRTAVTNAEGCALFRSIEVGDYTLTVNRPGYIDKKGNQESQTTATVSPNLLNVVTMAYDKSVDMTIAIKTLRPGAPFSTTATNFDSKAKAVSDNASEATVLRTFTPTSGGWVSSLSANKLFPHLTAYSYFTGSCAHESPVKRGNTTYFTDINQAAAVIGDPDVFQPQPVTVFQPALNLRVKGQRNAIDEPATWDAAADGLKVYATIQTLGTDTCRDIDELELSTRDWPGGAWGATPPRSDRSKNWVGQVGTNFDPGLPFGKYWLCLRDGTRWWKGEYDNTAPRGQATPVEIPWDNTWSSSKPSEC